MDYMLLRWDGSWAKYNKVQWIKTTATSLIIKEQDVPYTYEEKQDDIKEFGVITPFTESYYADNLRYQK